MTPPRTETGRALLVLAVMSIVIALAFAFGATP